MGVVDHVERTQVFGFRRAEHYVFEGHLIDEGKHVVLAVDMEYFEGKFGEAQTVHVAYTRRKLLFGYKNKVKKYVWKKKHLVGKQTLCFSHILYFKRHCR